MAPLPMGSPYVQRTPRLSKAPLAASSKKVFPTPAFSKAPVQPTRNLSKVHPSSIVVFPSPSPTQGPLLCRSRNLVKSAIRAIKRGCLQGILKKYGKYNILWWSQRCNGLRRKIKEIQRYISKVNAEIQQRGQLVKDIITQIRCLREDAEYSPLFGVLRGSLASVYELLRIYIYQRNELKKKLRQLRNRLARCNDDHGHGKYSEI